MNGVSLKRPLSLIAAISAVLLILYELIQIASGQLYQETLNYIDGTTLIELGIMTLVGVFAFQEQLDLKAVSLTLIAGLSFIFAYEALYKWSFSLAPFRGVMPPSELRPFVVQVGTAATVLTGFADRLFTLKKWTFVWLALFVLLWIFWLLVGFPVIKGELVHPRVIPIDFTRDMTYALNRATKGLLFLTYLTFFPSLRNVKD